MREDLARIWSGIVKPEKHADSKARARRVRTQYRPFENPLTV